MQTIQDAKILIVDDNYELLTLVKEELSSAGYHHLKNADSVKAARHAIAEELPELVILDINLPDGDGFSLFREIRAHSDVPILFLSARDADSDRLFGLGLGADDYMTKPFGLGELLARIAALLRRARLVPFQPPRADAPFRLGAHMIDGARLTVIAPDGTETPLAAREYELLRLLAAHPGEVLRRDDILDELWGVAFHGNTRTLDQHVALIRRKLGTDAARIETVRNVGYRLA